MIIDVLMLADGRYLADPTPNACPVCSGPITGVSPSVEPAERLWSLNKEEATRPPAAPWVLQPCGHGLDYFEMRVRGLNADESEQEIRRRSAALGGEVTG